MNVVLLLAAIQALFLCSLLVAKPSRSFADKVLMAWLAGIGVHTLIYFLFFQGMLTVPFLLNLNSAFPFLMGPFLLAYVAALVGMRQRFTGPDLLHLLPFAGFVVFIALTQGPTAFAVAPGDHSVSVSIFSISTLFAALLMLSVPAYIIMSLLVMHRARQAVPSAATSMRFRWIRALVVGLGAIWIAVMASALLSRQGFAQPHMTFWALTIVVYALGYLGLTRTSMFTANEFEALKSELQPKYRKSGLKAEAAKALHDELVAHVDGTQIYMDPDISLASLAESLGRSSNHVSQVINEFDACNFRDFINARRVAEACRRLEASQETSLLELAMDVGFNSKSSFNRAFRKFAGSTPSEYLARL